MKRILLYDTTQYYPSSPLFLEALQEISAPFHFFDEGPYIKPYTQSWIHKIIFRGLGKRPLSYRRLNAAFVQVAAQFHPEVVLVVKGLYLSSKTLELIKRRTGAALVNYATDDPFMASVSTREMLASIPLYDLYACTQRAIVKPVQDAGCRNALFVPFGYKPSLCFPDTEGASAGRFSSDVVFVGICDPVRAKFFQRLLESLPDVQIAFYGPGEWTRHPVLRRYYRGIAMGRDYRLALGGAKIAIAFGRRPHHRGPLVRAFEIPACGAFMLAERTPEHLELFEEGKEAAYFGSVEELAERVRYYLAHDAERARITEAAHRKVTTGGHTYKDRLLQMLKEIGD